MRSRMNKKEETIYKFKPFVFVVCRSKKSKDGRGNPRPRSGHRIVCNNKNLYSISGYNPDINEPMPMREMWRFNLSSRKWFNLESSHLLPNAILSSTAVLKGDVLFLYGGSGYPFGEDCSNQLYAGDLNDDGNFERIVATGKSLPEPQYGQASVMIQNYFYTVGGTDGYQFCADIHRLDLLTRQWEEVYAGKGRTDEPVGRYRHELCFDGERIILLGGGRPDASVPLQKIDAFNLRTNSWESIDTKQDKNATECEKGFPRPRLGHGCVQLPPAPGRPKGSVFIFGGFDGLNVVYKDVWSLDLHDMQWHCYPRFSLPKAVYFHSTALTPTGKVYSHGGIVKTLHGDQRLSTLCGAWLCIPSLSEMCWEAILFYWPHISYLSREKLCKIGLPLQYVERLID